LPTVQFLAVAAVYPSSSSRARALSCSMSACSWSTSAAARPLLLHLEHALHSGEVSRSLPPTAGCGASAPRRPESRAGALRRALGVSSHGARTCAASAVHSPARPPPNMNTGLICRQRRICPPQLPLCGPAGPADVGLLALSAELLSRSFCPIQFWSEHVDPASKSPAEGPTEAPLALI